MILSKRQCLEIKGYAILMIMLHNYSKFFMHVSGNEMEFRQSQIDNFLRLIKLSNFPTMILSFAGWVGVPLFIFLSAYGLSVKYSEIERSGFKYFRFEWRHLLKLFRLLIPLYAIFLGLNYLITGDTVTPLRILEQITLTINIFDWNNIDPGVYWFFGMIMQFYLLFPLLKRLSIRGLAVGIVLSLLFNYIVVYAMSIETSSFLRHNFIGWLPSFFAGMLMARLRLSPKRKTEAIICIVSTIVFSASFLLKWLTPLSGLLAIISFCTFARLVSFKAMAWVGTISASIFVVHPLVRYVIIMCSPYTIHALFYLVVYIIAVILLSWLHHKALERLPSGIFFKAASLKFLKKELKSK